MPWRRRGSGYTTKRGGLIRRPKVYEALRRKGASKTKAAKIANTTRKRR
jgi:hypothetical protein